MEQYIKDAMNDEVISKAAQFYGTEYKKISVVGGFENFVYEFMQGNKAFIMRFVHSKHRIYNQVLAELEFIDYLDRNGARVSTVIYSNDGNLVQKITLNDKEYFTVCVFEKAKGQKVIKDDMTNDFYRMFGSEVGKLHKLTKKYNPKHKRVEWHEENYFDIGVKCLPENDMIILEIYSKLVEKIKKIPKSIDNYGLIHTDLHFGNMFIHGGELTFFDWDDASYKHFISDIAIVLFYHFVYLTLPQSTINTEARRILALFLEGYTTENSFDYDSLKYLNDFLLLRTIILYIVIFAVGDDNLKSGFGKFYSEKFRDRIINNIPYIDLKKELEEY